MSDAEHDDDLMMIGNFARATGLTASALRFYADAGVLEPDDVDTVSGYRLYGRHQIDSAVMIRRLRDLGMPLARVREVLSGPASDAVRAIEEHLDDLVISTTEARRNAADVIADLPTASTSEVLTSLRGYILAEALDQVLTATVREPGIPVLESVLMEVDSEAVTFVATDRYRLVVRTIAAASDLDEPRSFILNGDDLRDVAATVRRDPVVHLVASVGGIEFTEPVESRRLSCRTVSEVFPDYRLMLDHLAELTARLTLSLTDLLHRVNESDGDRFTLDGEETVTFALTTLYPALTSAIGPEVMLEIRGPEQPVTIRSADRGDLTVVVMPVKP